jgi:translation initiation factor 2 beta subunit (eIF-2beta)/eIF-5
MNGSPFYVICCRCGKPEEGHRVEGRHITRIYWWLWCHSCVQEMIEAFCAAHD